MPEIQITEKFLINTGGWQALKHAKALVEMGRVVSFNYTPPVLRGLVREGEIEYRAGLKIRSYTDVENLCSCRDSREWGSICAHSMALGLALIQPKPTPAKPAPAPVPSVFPSWSARVTLPAAPPQAVTRLWLIDRRIGTGSSCILFWRPISRRAGIKTR